MVYRTIDSWGFHSKQCQSKLASFKHHIKILFPFFSMVIKWFIASPNMILGFSTFTLCSCSKVKGTVSDISLYCMLEELTWMAAKSLVPEPNKDIMLWNEFLCHEINHRIARIMQNSILSIYKHGNCVLILFLLNYKVRKGLPKFKQFNRNWKDWGMLRVFFFQCFIPF